MVKFTNAATNPKAMVVKLADTSVAVSAVSCSKGQLFNATNVTASIRLHIEFADESKTRLSCYSLTDLIIFRG